MGMTSDRFVVRGVTGAAIRKGLARVGISRRGLVAGCASEFCMGKTCPGRPIFGHAPALTVASSLLPIGGAAVATQAQGCDPLRPVRVTGPGSTVAGQASSFATAACSRAVRGAPRQGGSRPFRMGVVAVQACQKTLPGLRNHASVLSLPGL